MTDLRSGKGPWLHRFLIAVFNVLFGLLVFWLLGFILNDIGTWPGPVYQELEQEMLDPELPARVAALDERIAALNREIESQRSRQSILRDSTSNSNQTIDHFRDIQRLRLQQGEELTEQERESLAESEQRFLDNQRQYQELNRELSEATESLRDAEQQQRELGELIETRKEPIRARYQELRELHNWQVAALKLGVLAPLLALGVWLFFKLRGSFYKPMVYAYGIAVLIKVGLVMHEYFPSRYFKYVLILLAIAVVAWILIYLLRMVAHPRADYLLKQYREAYERFACPICDYPIRRGPLRYMLWSRRSLKKQPFPPSELAVLDEPYSCPSCATRLFEECSVCHNTRHVLLPACEKCGAEG